MDNTLTRIAHALFISYPVLPPTSNHLYFRGTILTKKAREYKEAFKEHVIKNYMYQISALDPGALYGLHLRFFFPTLINRSETAKSRYKRIDLTNRIKFLEDCLKEVVSIDDSQTFIAAQEKHHCPENPRVEITYYPVDPTVFGIPNVQTQ